MDRRAARRRRAARPVAREQRLERGQREVEEVLVVDRVELARARPGRGRTAPRSRPRRRRRAACAMPATNAVEVGHVREHVVGVETSARPSCAASSRGQLARRRTRTSVGCRARFGDRGDVRAPARCRAPGRPRRRSAAGGSRRCWRPRRRGSAGRGRRSATRRVGERRGVLEHRVGERREVDGSRGTAASGGTVSVICTSEQAGRSTSSSGNVGSGASSRVRGRGARWRAASRPSERTTRRPRAPHERHA